MMYYTLIDFANETPSLLRYASLYFLLCIHVTIHVHDPHYNTCT
jgi:hypothetical protein